VKEAALKTRLVLTIALAPLALTACMQARPSDRPAVSPAARVVGEPVSCIPLSQLRETKVRDDWTIDFVGSGDQVWRNTLTSRCPGLRAENAITYETSLSQLCSTDIVYVLETAGGLHRGPACGLGQFVPVKLRK
jgi:hypothetical protein